MNYKALYAGILATDGFSSADEHMQSCAKGDGPLMEDIHAAVDTLAGYAADKLWPLPKYREMLSIRSIVVRHYIDSSLSELSVLSIQG